MIDRLLQRYARAPEHPAKLRLFAWLYHWLRGRQRIEVVVGGGLRLRVHPDDHVDRGILFDHWHEALTSRFLIENLRPHEIAFIAGAHIGYHVLHAARAVGQSGRVIGCEPEPASLLRCWEHLELNHATGNVTLLCLAVSDTAGFLPLGAPPQANSGAAALLADADNTPYHATTSRIDETLSQLTLDRLDFLLLDVEGFERRALTGLGAHRPRLLVLESDPRHHERLGESQEEFFRFVRSLGYELYSIVGHRVNDPGFYPETNLVAVREGEPPPRWPLDSAAP